MFDNPLVSIIVPVYNVNTFLRDTIESILAQSFSDIEIILVDDGSTDGSSRICDEYVTRDRRIIVIHQHENCGVSAARNLGLSAARGKYISFVDSDDFVHPRLIEVLLHAIECSKCDFSMVKLIKLNPEDAKLVQNVQMVDDCPTQFINAIDYYKNMLHKGDESFCVAVGKLYYREKVSNIDFVGTMGEDQYWILKQLHNINKVALVTIPLYFWIQNPASVTHKKMVKGRIDFLWTLYDCYSDLPLSLSKPRAWCLERLYKRIIITRDRSRGTSFENEAEYEIKRIYKLTKNAFLRSGIALKTKALLFGLYHFPFGYHFYMWFCDQFVLFSNMNHNNRQKQG